MHPLATPHIPFFITAPGGTDVLFNAVIIFVVGTILLVGNLYFRLHAAPEHMAHGASKVQMEIVAVLTLISLFTHNHLFWIGALLLAMVQFPDFTTPANSIAGSLERIADKADPRAISTIQTSSEPREGGDAPAQEVRHA